jgi:hypothetical protein
MSMRASLRAVTLVVAFGAAFHATSIACCQAAESKHLTSTGNNDRLAVHEWGTFTSLQDEKGNAIGGINEDDEPVPSFVHRIATFLLLGPEASIPIMFQGAPQCHPDVTMRLETPVIYFHPNPSAKLPLSVDVEVAFKSGWLSEYYPAAEVEAPGVQGEMTFGPIRADTVGKLRWKKLQVGTNANGPKTSSPVWLAPRAVLSSGVTTTNGEHEQFLFYRGVGHVDSPLRVSQNQAAQSLVITADFSELPEKRKSLAIRPLWITEIRADKSCAFRELPGFEISNHSKPHVVATTSDRFPDSEFRIDNILKLSASMRAALIEDGLFPDEADALLNTWKLSYFESPGMRLFYLVPRAWTDQVLPMRLSADAELVRTMVGRVEIVTPNQRRLLHQIASGPASNPAWARPGLTTPQPAPEDFRAYEKLGRFRNALVLEELKRRPSKELQKFIDGYGLEGYRPQQPEAANSTSGG